ncbi:hypothetical protein ACLOJK_034679 [Asimina triloba]
MGITLQYFSLIIVFGDKAFEKFGKLFISLHFSDQHAGTHGKVLMFKFGLPGANSMADMTRLVALIPYYIDLVGRYKLSPQVRSKTEAARAKAAQEAYKELQMARQEAFQKKKAEKKKMMEEAEAKLSAEAIRRREERERARQLKKSGPKVKMTRARLSFAKAENSLLPLDFSDYIGWLRMPAEVTVIGWVRAFSLLLWFFNATLSIYR